MTNSNRIERTILLLAPKERVWRALTEPKLHALWWAAGDIQPTVGHRFELDMGPWGKQKCEVLKVQPEELLQYSFAIGTLDTIVTWRLYKEGSNTRLELVHEGFNLKTPMGKTAFEGMSQGWPGVLERLADKLEEEW